MTDGRPYKGKVWRQVAAKTRKRRRTVREAGPYKETERAIRAGGALRKHTRKHSGR